MTIFEKHERVSHTHVPGVCPPPPPPLSAVWVRDEAAAVCSVTLCVSERPGNPPVV